MRRRTFLLGSLAAAAGVTGALACTSSSGSGAASRTYGSTTLTRRAASADAPNVLFFSIDDLNDWVGFLGNHPGTHTPNMDALAAESLSFTHAYAPAPMCLPSRTAVMFGLQPHTSEVYDHSAESLDRYAALHPEFPSVVDWFWAAGYATFATGKIFHDPQPARWDDHFRQPWYVPGHRRDEEQWAGRFDPDWISPYDGEPIGRGERFTAAMTDFGPSNQDPEEDPDGLATRWVLQRLRQDRTAPFFLAPGVYLPHEPWRAPQRFFDLHPLEEVVVPELRPEDLEDLGPYAREEIVDTHGAFEMLLTSGVWQEAVQAYQASISYADWCVGQVLDELHSGPYADDTIVALWSDHGYHLGEKLHLHKFTLWERATRVPMLLRVPGQLDDGSTFDAPVSVMDLGPTLAELCDVPTIGLHQGESLLSLLEDPSRADERPPVMTWLEGNHAVRRGPWRYIRYRTGETELYDHRSDPDERTNLAGLPEHAATVTELDRYLPLPVGS